MDYLFDKCLVSMDFTLLKKGKGLGSLHFDITGTLILFNLLILFDPSLIFPSSISSALSKSQDQKKPGGEFGRGWHCKSLCLPLGSRGLAPEKNPVFTFLHCLKWVFRSVFSSFNNAFWFALMILKWDQEKVRLANYPLWMSSGLGRVEYLKLVSTIF